MPDQVRMILETLALIALGYALIFASTILEALL